MHAADALVVPLLPTPLSARTLEQLFDFIAARGWHDVNVLPFFSMVDRRRSLHKETIAELRARFPAILADRSAVRQRLRAHGRAPRADRVVRAGERAAAKPIARCGARSTSG